MAIDTAPERRAAAGVTFPLAVSVTPDSDEDAFWRKSVGWGWGQSGTSLGPPVGNIARVTFRNWHVEL